MSRFYLAYALRSLWRGGQRSVLALACIAFAVLSLVSMQILAGIVRAATVVPARAQLGGDFALSRKQPFSQTDLAQLEAARAQGLVRGFTLFAPNAELTMLRRPSSGRVHFLSRALGVDAQTFPLVGEIVLAQPVEGNLRELLRAAGSVLVTRDVAARMRLALGDTVYLGGLGGTASTPLRVTAIAAVIPDRQGDSMLFDLATAQHIAGDQGVVWSAGVLGPESAAQEFQQKGWTVTRSKDVKPGTAARVFSFMLKGAGLLGLLLGGIGVANTLTVALARRTQEIAVLKTIGYRRRDLLALLGVETAILGLIGSLLGGLLALGLSRQLMVLLDATEGSLMLQYRVDAATVAGGTLAGVITALVFGTYATLRASAVRPALLLRQLQPPPTRGSRLTLFTGTLVAGAVFAVLGSAIMGSLLQGIGVIAAGALGLVVLGLLFGLLLLAVLRLPIPGPLLHLARRNLQHQRGRAIVAVIALFVGSFTVGFASAAMLSARQRILAQRGSDAGLNLRIHARAAAENQIRQVLRNAQLEPLSALSVEVTAAAPDGRPRGVRTLAGLEPAEAQSTLQWVEGQWSDAPDAVHLPAALARRNGSSSLRLGDTIVARTAHGVAVLRIAGFFTTTEQQWSFGSLRMITSLTTARSLADAQSNLTVSAAIPVERAELLVDRLGAELPRAMVLSRRDFNDLLIRSYTSLFFFVAGMAGLAFLAGVVLIANAVGLALVERKRELGILKAIGYSSRHVLSTILLENAILGALAGATGVIAVRVVATIVNIRFRQVGLDLGPVMALALFLLAIGLALGAALVVAWRPSRMRPLAVLRQE